jgi:hypothetical protein
VAQVNVMAYLSMCGAGHVCPIDLYDLITGLQTTITGHQSFWEHLLQDYNQN